MASRLGEHIAALAAIERGSATTGERRSAEWVSERLRELGASDVRLESFEFAHTFAHAHAVHYAGGLAAALRGSRTLAAGALLSFELDYSGRAQWLRSLLRRGEGTNVVARLPARGSRRRQLVLVAHHDAAHTGRMWDPRLTAAGDRAAARSGKRASLALPAELAFAALALAGPRVRPLRAAAGGVLATALALALDQARSPVVPGANDNASGVAGVLELVRLFTEEPLENTEVHVLVCGCEEAGMGGMAAWLARARPDRADTLVLGLDTIGSGEPVVLEAEGGIWPVRYREEDVARGVRQGLRRWRLGGWTDPALAALAGIPALSILSVRDGGFPNYHLPSDVPEHVDLDCVRACVRASLGIARAFSA